MPQTDSMQLSLKKLLFRSLLFFLVLAGVNAAFNIYVNPYEYYGDEVVGSAPIYNARYGKYQEVIKLDSPPQVIVMGSSNSMRMRPEKIKELTGMSAFNYGVFHARAEDFYCIGQQLTEKKETKPEYVLLCVDDWNLADEPALPDEVFAGAEKRLAYKPILARHLDDYSALKVFWGQLKTSVSWTQTASSFKALKMAGESGGYDRHVSKFNVVFYPDGVRKKYLSVLEAPVTDLTEAGEYDVTADLKKHHADLLTYSQHHLGFLTGSHEMFEKFSPRRWDYFKRFIANLDSTGVKVIINVMPNQPYYQQLVRENSNYDERMEDLLNRLHELQKKYPAILLVKDNHVIENFGGFENQFFDHMHPSAVNSDLMLESIVETLPADAL